MDSYTFKLKPYSEPVSPENLICGELYFLVTFIDEDLRVPCMETLIFIGNGEGNQEKSLLFQDIASYQVGVRYDDESSEKQQAVFYKFSPGNLNSVFEYEKGLEELVHCALRREEMKGRPIIFL